MANQALPYIGTFQRFKEIRVAIGCEITNAPGVEDGQTACLYGVGFGSSAGTLTLWENSDKTGTSIVQTVSTWTDTKLTFTGETTAFGYSVDTIVYAVIEVSGGGECQSGIIDVHDGGSVTVLAATWQANMNFGTNNTTLGKCYGLESGEVLDVTDLLPAGADPICQCTRRFKNNSNPRYALRITNGTIGGCGGLDCGTGNSGNWINGERCRRAV